MLELSNLNCIEECNDWMSKKELADMCRVDEKTIQRTVNDILNLDPRIQIQSHIKKGGYHNLEVFYDGYLVKLIQAKLLSNQANRGNSSDTIKSVVKTAVKNEDNNWYSVKEICDICNTSRQSWINFKNDFNCKTGFTVKRNLKECDKNVDYYPENILKLFQAWLMKNQSNQGNSSDTIKSIVKSAVKNELTKTLSKDEIKLELARNKTLQIQYQAQKQIITEQERTKRVQERAKIEVERTNKEKEKTKRKETELELLRQKNISKALKIKSFTEPLKKEIKTMTNELAQQAVQAEYTKKLRELDADGKYMLYIFHNPTNPTIYKIGKSNSLGNRLAIGTSENPNLQILYKKWCSCQIACDELEETIHQELREYNYKNYSDTGSKEWFVLTKDKLNEIVNKYDFVETI